jgi:hypothetical protein
VWAHDEYEKLRLYDVETFAQIGLGAFACHATPGELCHGWAVVHGDRALALRFDPTDGPIPEPAVPLFASGAEAADHGQVGINKPCPAAVRTISQLVARHERLQ